MDLDRPRWHHWAWQAFGVTYFFGCAVVATQIHWFLGLAVWAGMTAAAAWVIRESARRRVRRIRAERLREMTS
jgi:hypothetical protein